MTARHVLTIAVLASALLCARPVPAQSCQPFRILVFTKTAGFVHGPQITSGISLIQSLGGAHGFAVDQTADATLITQANLAQYAVVVFFCTSGDILDPLQQAAFEGYILGGGGFVGVHSAADTEYSWPFYGAMLGAWFLNHPAIQTATVHVVDPTHPSTAPLPLVFQHDDEWYNFQTNVASNPQVNVLMTVDESTYTGGSMGAVHPVTWCQDSGAGRSWYTAIGHTLAQYSTQTFADHLLGGILWTAGSTRTSAVCGVQSYGAPSGAGALSLGGTLVQPTHATLQLSGAAAGAPGILGVSSCSASASGGGITVLVDLASPGFIGFVPLAFDGAGQSQLTIPLLLQLPGSWGTSLYLQAADVGPSLKLSNGLHLSLCP